MIKRVLVGTDTSAAADVAVDAAAELARTNDAELLVVYARPGNGRSGAEAFDPGKAPDPARYLRDLSARFPAVDTTTREEPGDPVEVLCQVAEREQDFTALTSRPRIPPSPSRNTPGTGSG